MASALSASTFFTVGVVLVTFGRTVLCSRRHGLPGSNNDHVQSPHTSTPAAPYGTKNVLLIVIDDLRPQTKAYGVEFMKTPNIDRLASQGVVFRRAYAQQSICSPSRNSFLSGRYPDKTKVWNFDNDFREGPGAQWIALPEFFKLHGYFTTGAGKVYHPNYPKKFDEPRSWSEPWVDMGKCSCGGVSSFPPGGSASCEGLDPTNLTCGDDRIVEIISGKLQRALNGTLGAPGQPWLIAAGLHKPHLPFYARPEDFRLYPTPAPPAHSTFPQDAPYAAYHSCLSGVDGVNNSNWGDFVDISNNNMTIDHPMEVEVAARLRRGYYASVTYTDRNVGLLLDALDGHSKTPRNDTVVVLLGDHGWSLGEGNEFCKMTNTEAGTRIPFIFRAPGSQHISGRVVMALAEAVDLYKTLVDLSGLGLHNVDKDVDGVSLAPYIIAENITDVGSLRVAARSQFPRCYSYLINTTSKLPQYDRTDCQDVPRNRFDLMGLAIRTVQWRLVEWFHWDGLNLMPKWNATSAGIELYDHRSRGKDIDLKDPFSGEAVNLALKPAYKNITAALRRLLRQVFQPKVPSPPIAYSLLSSCSMTTPPSCSRKLQSLLQHCINCAITFLPPGGTFIFNHQGRLNISNTKNITIEGMGSTAIINGDAAFIGIYNTSNVTINNLSVRSKRVPFTLARVGPVVKPDKLSLIVDQSLYPFPYGHEFDWLRKVEAIHEVDPSSGNPLAGGLDWINVINSTAPTKDSVVPGVPLQVLSDGKIELENRNFSLRQGSTVILRHFCFGPHHGIIVESSFGIQFSNLTIMSAAGMATLFVDTVDISLSSFRDVPYAPYPMASNADAVHLSSCRGRVSINNMHARRHGDDGINVHSNYFVVQSVDFNNGIYTLKLAGAQDSCSLWDLPRVHIGDIFDVRRPDTLASRGKFVVANILGNQFCVDGSLAFSVLLYARDSKNQSIPLKYDLALSESASPQTIEIINSTVEASRASGIVVMSHNVTISQCKFVNLSSAGVNVCPYWNPFGEANIPRHVTIVNSTFVSCALGHRTNTSSTWGGDSGFIAAHSPVPMAAVGLGGAIQNIVVRGNLFAKKYDAKVFCTFNNVNIVQVEMNKFSYPTCNTSHLLGNAFTTFGSHNVHYGGNTCDNLTLVGL